MLDRLEILWTDNTIGREALEAATAEKHGYTSIPEYGTPHPILLKDTLIDGWVSSMAHR